MLIKKYILGRVNYFFYGKKQYFQFAFLKYCYEDFSCTPISDILLFQSNTLSWECSHSEIILMSSILSYVRPQANVSSCRLLIEVMWTTILWSFFMLPFSFPLTGTYSKLIYHGDR